MTKQQHTNQEITRSIRMYALYAIAAAVMTYGFASWAIDTGSILLYALCFASLYYCVHFSKSFIKHTFFTHDKATTTRRSSSKNHSA